MSSGNSTQFVKYVFSDEIWFVKTSTRIVKYKSQVVKLSPVNPDSTKQAQEIIFFLENQILRSIQVENISQCLTDVFKI